MKKNMMIFFVILIGILAFYLFKTKKELISTQEDYDNALIGWISGQ